MQLEDNHTLLEDMDFMAKVAEGITSRRDKNVIMETSGEDKLLDRIQKVLMVSISPTQNSILYFKIRSLIPSFPSEGYSKHTNDAEKYCLFGSLVEEKGGEL